MAETARKSPRRWLWRALWAFGAVVSCVALAVGVGVVMLKGSYGATLVRDFADGRSAGGYGELELGSVRGDVLGRFRIDSLAIRDKNGVWLQADDIEISWSPLALTGRVLDLDQATVGRLDVLRRPERRGGPQRSSAGGGFDWSRWRLELGDAGVDRLALAEGVAGPAAVLSADASLSRDAGGWRGEVSAERLDAPGDHLNLRFEVNQDIQAQFELSAAPDGPLAEIFRASGSALSATGQVLGDRLSGSARASITVDGAEAGQVETGWSSGRVEASGRADLRLWPGLEGLAARVGGPVRFEAGAPFGEEGLTTLDIEGAVLDVRSGALTVTARPGSQGAVDVTADLGEGALALITGGQATAQAARLEGRFDPNGGGSVDGRLSAQEVTTPGGIVADSLQGRAAMAGPFSAPQLSWDVTTTGASLGVETLDAAIGPQAELRGVAVWRREAGQIAFSELSAALAAGTVSGSGGLELAARRYDFQLRSSALNLEALTDLVTGPGAVSAQVEGGFDGALQAQLDVDGFAPAGALQSRLSGPISGAASLQRGADGALRLDSVRLESPQARVEGAGRRDGRGWRFEGDAVWSGAAPVSALTLEGALTARFEADAGPEGVQARVEARAPALVVGPEPVDSPRLRLELAGPFEAVSGTARLTGQGRRGAIDLTARFARDGAGVSVPELTGQAGGFTVAGQPRPALGPCRSALGSPRRPVSARSS